MASNGQGSIDEIIGQQGFDQVSKLQTMLKDLVDELTRAKTVVSELNAAFGLKNIGSSINVVNTSISKSKEMTLTIAAQKVETQRLNAELKNQATMMSETVGAYANLDAQQKKAEKSARDIGIQFGINSEQFKKAAAASNEYLNRLKAVDEALGNSRRNVGNYQGAVYSLSQVIRELPAFTYSAQQGFLAIGNNMPILIDQFKLLKSELGSSRAALAAFARSIFSFVNVFTIVSGLFTIFYKDIMKFITGVNLAREVNDALVKSMGEGAYSDAINTYRKLNDNIDLVKKGLLSKKAALDEYNSTMGETTGKLKNWDKAEDTIKSKGDAWLEFMKLKAQANSLYAQSAALSAQAEAVDFQQPGIGARALAYFRGSYLKFSNLGKSLKELNKIEKESLEESTNSVKVELTNKADVIEKKADEIAEAMKKLALAEGFQFDDPEGKGKGREKKSQNRIDELKKEYDNRLNDLKIYHQNNEETELEFQNKVLKLNAEFAKERINSVKNLNKEEYHSAKEWKAKLLEDTKKINDEIAKDAFETFKRLEEDGAHSYEVDKKQLDDKKKAWDEAYSHYMSLIDKLEENEDKVRANRIAKETKAREDQKELDEKSYDAKVELLLNTLQLSTEIGNAIFNNELLQFDAREKRLKEYYDNEKRFIQQSGFSASQKAKMQDKLDAETEAKRKQIDRDRITALRKQAIFNKALTTTEIIINTAAAISNHSKLAPPLNYIQMAADAVIGAAQLARVIATPLPQYAKGRKGGRKEWAIVGEAGQEAIVHNGNVELTPNKPTVTLLPEGASVIPNHELIKNAAYVHLAKQGTVTTDKLQAALIESYERNTKELQQIKEVLIDKNFSLTNNELSGYEAYRKSKVQ